MKWFLCSKRFWGIIFFLAGLVGIDLPPELQEEAPMLAGQIVDGLSMAFGAALAIYGYFKRDKKLTILPASAGLPWLGRK